MQQLKKWGVPVLTGLIVLAAVVLPRQLSALRDRGMWSDIHVEPLSEDDLIVRELPLPEKLELLGRAILYPDLEVFSTTQSLPSPGEPGAEQAEEAFFKSVEYLTEWGALPESFDPGTLEFQSGSRAVYVRSDGHQSASMLYLQGATGNRDNFWIVVDEETGLPVWIDCALRSVPAKSLPTAEDLGTRFLDGLGLEVQQHGPNVWEIDGAGGLMYSAGVESAYGRISVGPLGFMDDFGQGEGDSSGAPMAESR